MSSPSFPGSAETAPAVSAEPHVDQTVSAEGRGAHRYPRQGPRAGGSTLPQRRRFGGESLFQWLSTAAGSVVLIIIVAIAAFLIIKAVPAIRADKANFLSYNQWFPDDPTEPKFGIAALAFGLWAATLRSQLRSEPRPPVRPELPEHLEELEAEMNNLRQQLIETQERLDFTDVRRLRAIFAGSIGRHA